MLIVLCLNIYMANYLRIDIHTLYMQEWHMSADDCFFFFFFFFNKNIIVIVISILVNIDRKNSESCFLLFFFSENITC